MNPRGTMEERVKVFYRGKVALVQPGGRLGAVGEDLEECGPQGAVVVPPHPPQAAELLGQFLITLPRQHRKSLGL